MAKIRGCPSVIRSCPWVSTDFTHGLLCTNGYPLAASAVTHGLLLVTHGPLQLQMQPMCDQFQCCLLKLNHIVVFACTPQGQFVWSGVEQAFLFSAIFWGGLLSGFPAGWLADRYGPKILCFAGVAVCMVSTLLTPVTSTQLGHVWLFVLRFIMGIGQVTASGRKFPIF